MAQITGNEKVTGLPNYDKQTLDGITIHQSFTQEAMLVVPFTPDDKEGWCDKCIDLAWTMVDRLNAKDRP